MKKTLYIFQFLLLICLSLHIADAKSYNISSYWNQSGKLNTIIVNNVEYSTAQSIAKFALEGGRYDARSAKITNSDETLAIASGSFFVSHSYKNKKNELVAQMTLPAIWYKNAILLPTHSFFKSLDEIGLFDVEFDGSEIDIFEDNYLPKEELSNRFTNVNSEKGKFIFNNKVVRPWSQTYQNFQESQFNMPVNHHSDRDNIDIDKIFPKSKKQQLPTKQMIDNENSKIESNFIDEFTKTTKPNSYAIPKKLKRNDLDSLRK